MDTSAENKSETGSPGSAEQPERHKKVSSPHRSQGGKNKRKRDSKTSATSKSRRKANQAKSSRAGSKTNRVLNLLRPSGGVTAQELMKVTGWQPHSVRGFLSGTIGKKMGLTVTSIKDDKGHRRYSINT